MAWPGTRTYDLVSFVEIRPLFIITVTPALDHGLTGSLVYIRSKDLPKHL